jgi:WD40 repeat protein
LALVAAALSPDGTQMATGASFDTTVRIWDIGGG